MPNWVYTSVSISGPAEHIARFKDRASATATITTSDGEEHTVEGAISFWNFKAPPIHKYDEYYGMNGWKNGQHLGQTEWNWYEWNCKHWGTKWDASSAELTDEDSINLSYRFDTAWAPAEGAFKAMVKPFPELEFEFYCEEEQGWGVIYTGSKGKLKVKEQWDIPSTHAEHEKRDQTCVCDWDSDDPTNWFDDCPDKAEEIAKLTKENNEGENND
jgi:hypothetical protein